MEIGLDTETHLMRPGAMAPKVVCLTYDGINGRGIETRKIEILMEMYLKGENTLIGHNFAFDAAALSATYPALLPLFWTAYDEEKIVDTLLAERLLDIATGTRSRPRGYYRLDGLAKRHLDVDIDKDNPWRMRFGELDGIPPEEWPREARKYAVDDAWLPRAIWQKQQEDPNAYGEDFHREVRRQSAFSFPLYLMTCWGVRCDPEKVRKLSESTRKQIAELLEELKKAKIVRPDGVKDTTEIKKRIAKAFEEPPRTAKGAIKMTKEVISQCDDKVLQKKVKYDALVKLNSTYVKKLWEATAGPLHASFNTLGALSGRTSSSRPNLQNQPREGGARECFSARPGHAYILCDYDSQELRTLAQVCMNVIGSSTLAKEYQKDPDFDPHTAFAATLHGWTYEDAMARKEAGDKEVKARRQQAKAANFGFPGGLGAKTFVKYARGYGVELTEDEAQKLKREWLRQWPSVALYFQWVSRQLDEGAILMQEGSRRRRGGLGFCDGANTMFQGLAADASKTAVFMVSRECYVDKTSPLFGCRPVMLVHDELIVEAPLERAHEAAKRVETLMVESMALWCPDVPARATPALCRFWSKDAEPVYHQGRLVPWEPE